MASLIEVARQTHEESERYTQALSEMLSLPPAASHRDNIKRALRASTLVDRVVERNAFLASFYSDDQGERKVELASLSSDGVMGNAESSGSAQSDIFANFYTRLEQLKDHHRKYPSTSSDAFSIDYAALDASISSAGGLTVATALSELDVIDRIFSGEESGGRFLDLYIQHESFLNLKGVRRITYLQYLDELDLLTGEQSRIPTETKKTEAYRKYIASLRAYLSSFMRKTRPLEDVDALENSVLEDVASANVSELLHAEPKDDLAAQGNTAAEGVWCDVCRRSYAKQSVYDGHLSGAKHKKAALRAASETNLASFSPGLLGVDAERSRLEARAREILTDEALVKAFGQALLAQRAQTRSNVERKAVLTERERQSEAEAAAAEGGAEGDASRAVEAADDEDDDGKIYNPLKLPLGWDGKPIPFWLYKLHGLGVEYKCEICSDHIYQGRKNFERHFQESRHAFGMRALNLPNTRHFHEITRIEDALALAEKLKRQGRLAAEEEGDAEEVEDENGNTYTRKTYDLLKRQGLL